MALLLCLLLQDFTVLDSGIRRKEVDPRFERITDEASLKALWDSLPPCQPKKEMPKVDFTQKMVIAVLTPLDAHAKELKVESLKEENGTLTLTYSLRLRPKDGGGRPLLPYIVLEVPRSSAPVHIVEIDKDFLGKTLQQRTVKKLDALK